MLIFHINVNNSIINIKIRLGHKNIFKNIKDLVNNKYKRPFRFVVVGIANTLVDFIVFFFFHNILGIYYTLSQGFGYSFGVLNSFIFNKIWTFESKVNKKKTAMEFIRFIIINALSLFVSMYGISQLVSVMGINVYIAKIIVTLLTQLINYLGYKIWVFKK